MSTEKPSVSRPVERFVRWLFWRSAYVFRNRWRRESLDQYLRRWQRCGWPWKKFKPCAYHNDRLKKWQIHLSDEVSYTKPRVTITVNAHISDATGKIIGFDVWDETLESI